MYLRTNNAQGDIRIPENYRGNAFRADEPPAPPPPTIDHVSFESEYENSQTFVSDNTPIPVFSNEIATEAVPEKAACPKAPPRSAILSSLLPPKPEKFTSNILGDIGLEELIIIGLMLLLSQSDSDDDILLLLAVLLFCK